jgi:uncharacterized protein (TIGR02453 family)
MRAGWHNRAVTFTGFGKGATAFYEELAANNSRDWWLAHKRRYEDEVRRPMEELLQDVAAEFGEAKLFRPNRDTRFSKDKSPYKLNIAAVIFGEEGGSVYVSLGADGLHVGGGGYHLDRDQLARYRAAVDADASGTELMSIAATLRKAKADVTSHSSLKTAPRGYTADHPRIDLLRQDGVIGMWSHRSGQWLARRTALDRVVSGWRALQPLNDWMAAHVGPSTMTR